MLTISPVNKRIARRLAAVSFIVVAAAAVQPWLWTWARSYAEDFHRRRSENEQLTRLIERVESGRDAWTAQQVFLEDLDMVAPRDHAAVPAIESLEHLAAARGISLVIDEVSVPSTDGKAAGAGAPVQPIVISLSVVGDAAVLLGLIDDVERLPLLARFRNVLLEPARSESSAAGVGGFVLTAKVEFFMQQHDAAVSSGS